MKKKRYTNESMSTSNKKKNYHTQYESKRITNHTIHPQNLSNNNNKVTRRFTSLSPDEIDDILNQNFTSSNLCLENSEDTLDCNNLSDNHDSRLNYLLGIPITEGGGVLQNQFSTQSAIEQDPEESLNGNNNTAPTGPSGPTGPTCPTAPEIEYTYGFTNSELFYFISNLSPIEFILFETVITIIIAINLNLLEKQLVAGFLVDIGVSLGNLAEQEAFQIARKKEKQAKIDRQESQKRREAMQRQIDKLEKELAELNH